jgi:FdhE protein
MRTRRGGPGDFDARLGRVADLLGSVSSATEALTVLARVLRHQRGRAATPQVSTAVERLVVDEPRQRIQHEFPLLDPVGSVDPIAAELEPAVDTLDGDWLPDALGESGEEVRRLTASGRAALVETWLADSDVLAPTMEFWCRVAAGPVFELAAAAVLPLPDGWSGPRCPVCGGTAQVSVIAEESGEFMGGSPRRLVCARCAAWWSFPRATCLQCGEHDPRLVTGFVARGRRAVRIDGCEACHGYVKTFDLREPDARDIVPLVDDVATLSLDLWAQEQGFHRANGSLAGV